MKISAFLQHIGLVSIVLTVAIGCASTPESTESVSAPVSNDDMSMSKAAEETITRAKAARYRVNGLGCEWSDTGSLIAEAEAQGKAGRNVTAIGMASQAEARALNVLKECQKSEPKKVVKSPDSNTGSGSYTVFSGDTLWGIAAMNNVYANPYQWPLIYRKNSDQIKDADLIYPGQVFSIDLSPSSSQVDAAIAHAKNRGAWSVGTVEASDRAYLGQ